MSDILAALYAIYLAQNMTSTIFGSQLSSYYGNRSKYGKRFTNFVNGRTKSQLRNDVYIYTKNTSVVPFVQWPLFKGATITDEQSRAARDAFVDYIWNKQAAE